MAVDPDFPAHRSVRSQYRILGIGLIRIADVCLKLDQMGKQAELSAAMYWFKRLKSLTNQVADRARNEQGIKVPD